MTPQRPLPDPVSASPQPLVDAKIERIETIPLKVKLDRPFFYSLIADQTPYRDGIYTLPAKPGWGMTFDPDYLEHARRTD